MSYNNPAFDAAYNNVINELLNKALDPADIDPAAKAHITATDPAIAARIWAPAAPIAAARAPRTTPTAPAVAPPAPPATAAVSPGLNAVAPSGVSLGALRDAIRSGTAAPVALSALPASDVAPDEIVARLEGPTKALGAKAYSQIEGASLASVAGELVIFLTAARRENQFGAFLQTAIFSVGLGYTVSESWAGEYGSLKSPHFLTTYEVKDRKGVAATTTSKAVNWIATSTLNAHAARLAGHLIVASAPPGSYLAKLAARAGTILNPPPESDKKPRSEIMRAANKELSTLDKAVADKAKAELQRTAIVVGLAMGQGDSDFDAVMRMAAAYAKTVL